MLFLVTFSSYLFVGLLERPTRTGRVVYAIVAVLAVYAHYFAVYVLLVQGATLVTLKRRAAWAPAWIATAVTIVVACAPVLWFASRVGPTAIIGWIQPPALRELWSVPVTLTGGNAAALISPLLASMGWRRPGWRRAGGSASSSQRGSSCPLRKHSLHRGCSRCSFRTT